MTNLWKLENPLVLASTSATRQHLLRSILIPFEVKAADIDERSVELRLSHLSPDRLAMELASAKGAQVSNACPDRLVVAADQTLALGEDRFHKPASMEEARQQLGRLSGRTHALHSGVVCFKGGKRLFADVQSAHLTMRQLGSTFLDAYLHAAGDAVMKSVGGYQVEGLGVHLFERIEGDQSTILGLPLLPLLAFLRNAGALEA